MTDTGAPKLSKWPFFAADFLLVVAAVAIFFQSARPLPLFSLVCVLVCACGAAVCAALPFILEYVGLIKLLQAQTLTAAVSKLGQVEAISGQIASATGQWQNIHGEAEKVNAAAKAIADRMTNEVKAFSEFMERANEGEKANLRLEVEKLHRAESDWLQVLVRTLDHVFAVYVGALRSGQPALVEQLGHFQSACRDAARRVGLVPFVPGPEEQFDPERHQAVERQGPPPAGTAIREIVATGYTFQGRLLRPALVRVADGEVVRGTTPASPAVAQP
jgi:molecular chaperone GrpE (heat shock protein)